MATLINVVTTIIMMNALMGKKSAVHSEALSVKEKQRTEWYRGGHADRQCTTRSRVSVHNEEQIDSAQRGADSECERQKGRAGEVVTLRIHDINATGLPAHH